MRSMLFTICLLCTAAVQAQLFNAPMEPAYDFPFSMKVHITNYKNGQPKDDADVQYYINPDNANFATRGSDGKKKNESTLVVFDQKNNSMVILDDGTRTAMAFGMNAFGSRKKTANAMKCQLTGKTKTIKGYICESCTCTRPGKNERSEMWITKQIPVNIAAGSRNPLTSFLGEVEDMGGLMMESNFYENDQLKVTMQVTEVNESSTYTVNTGSYQSMR